MPISTISVLRVCSAAESFLSETTLKALEDQSLQNSKYSASRFLNHEIRTCNKDGAGTSDDYQSQLLNIKRFRILYLAVLLLSQVDS